MKHDIPRQLPISYCRLALVLVLFALAPAPAAERTVEVRDEDSLRAALRIAQPGTHVRIAPGRYRPGAWAANLQGTVKQPIIIEGSDEKNPPLFEGGAEAWHLSDCSYLTLRNIISIPTVFIPAGKYLITETIDLKANVLGEGTAIVEQKNSEKDVFSSTFAWRLQVSGLTLVGGQHQLHIGNPNVDTGRITIEKCAFYNARGTAIRLRQGSNSTQMSGRDGVFYNCNQALVNWCDLTSVTDCWISRAHEMKDRAVIENRGVLTLQNICGVPAVNAENDQRWIDNYGTVTPGDLRRERRESELCVWAGAASAARPPPA